MRVVSLVPSWTETLLTAGVEVVGRTRFCVHPRAQVGAIARIGGTKDWDFDRVLALKPDLVVLDREENPRSMAARLEAAAIPYFASHIDQVGAMPGALRELARCLGHPRLMEMAAQWEELLARPAPSAPALSDLPGVIEWGDRPGAVPIERLVYVIWREPWMRVGRETFIGSVLQRLGYGELLDPGPEKYPQFELSAYDPQKTLLLFSSEPYPFLRHKAEMHRLGFAQAFVDGEKFSWFGVRSFEFLTKPWADR